MNSPSVESSSIIRELTRVMICMLQTTYGLSVTSIPIFEIGEPMGPMEKGITYMVRPFMQPLYKANIVLLSSSGAIQLFVGPAFSFKEVLIKVRSSTRATSLGSDRNRKLLGRFFSTVALPLAIICAIIRSYSSFVPLHT